ncbi:MAG: hypothetical protein H6813_06720 [Phycisphaeraceae bacterium]|nr:hypothetical protein [Phycisphaeraceae bacterium]MCB9848164.1 hypothetical protein [Phycisphaeraceae bacterium]
MSVAPAFGPFLADLHRVERAGQRSEVVRLRKHLGDEISPAVYFDPGELIWVITALQSVLAGLCGRSA